MSPKEQLIYPRPDGFDLGETKASMSIIARFDFSAWAT
jgi:hypothetical protein